MLGRCEDKPRRGEVGVSHTVLFKLAIVRYGGVRLFAKKGEEEVFGSGVGEGSLRPHSRPACARYVVAAAGAQHLPACCCFFGQLPPPPDTITVLKVFS